MLQCEGVLDLMNQWKRAALTVTIMFFGWCLMGLAYDKPQWQFEAAGIIGVLAALGALVWWVYDVPKRNRREAQRRE